MSTALPSIVETIEIEASPTVVWRFLSDPALVPGWLGCMRFSGTVGSTFFMQMDAEKRAADNVEGATHCEILELHAPERFVFSWFLPETPRTTVSIKLTGHAAGGTTVTLEHSGWDQFEPGAIEAIRSALEGGWRSFVLPGLKSAVEAEA